MVPSREMFYIGGRYVEGHAGHHNMQGQMYVERLFPSPTNETRPYPLVFVHGGTRTGADWLTKPDGEPGWADYFLSQGYEVYLVDAPFRGRSAWYPNVDDVMVISAETIQKNFTACASYGTWPQARFHTQWPGTGVMGDQVFDRFFASGVQMIKNQELQESASQEALVALLDRIGEPVVILAHSNGGGVSYLIADARPHLVKAIVSFEPKGPPFSRSAMLSSHGNQYGVCQAPITYDPPVGDPAADLITATRKAGDPDLMDATLQAESPTPRKLINLLHIPVLVVTAEASYHAEYDWCSVEYLRQAGVETEHLKLKDRGILGNGHMMFMESNSDEIARAIHNWITETLTRLGTLEAMNTGHRHLD
ncbi:hypothetical protein N0V93_006119 [Gnomoniopsis smithogilvyi]|uniref:AB hydrolase-1 domain-containing protein n=1 Tax=Gnomoniopsis smithogilvyi TaxID=1191159 RepID=A0A9W8YN12_9PEZI|nr:hypothetical protein N0V93_006119 [Gnomoniopsis smithogilvyi]